MERVVTTDICVVGAGPAGSILSHALAKAGKRVVLMEQGPNYGAKARIELVAKRQERVANELESDFHDDWPKKFSSPPVVAEGKDKYFSHTMAGVGGMALHWNGMSPRPLAEDLKVRTLFGYGRDYPITYEELEPWLLRAEHEMGISGGQDNPYASPRSGPFPMPAHEPSEFETEILAPAVRKVGWTPHSLPWAINSRPYDDRVQCMRCRYCVACPSGARYAPDLSHVRRFVTMPNATLLTETKLLRLESKTGGGRVVAAHATHSSGDTVVVKANSYVLAMGGIETPRMLLLSTDAKNKNGFGNAGGQVGVGFADKLANQVTMSLKKRIGAHTYGYPTMWTEHHRTNVPRRERGTMTMTFWPHGAIEGGGLFKVYRDLATTNGVLSLPALHSTLSRGLLGITFVEATENNRLMLDPDVKDAWGLPVARTETALTDRDRAAMDASIAVNQVLGDAMGAEAMRSSWEEGWVLWESHPTGGAAMASSPDQGACDPNAKVFGTENLYLASGAIFPHAAAYNPTLTICAFALRLAAHLGGAS